MSHLKTRYINETGEYPIVESACYYKTEYVQWLEKLVEQNSDSPASPVQQRQGEMPLASPCYWCTNCGSGECAKCGPNEQWRHYRP